MATNTYDNAISKIIIWSNYYIILWQPNEKFSIYLIQTQIQNYFKKSVFNFKQARS